MGKEFESNRVINGTWGEMWFDDDYVGEIESCKGEVEITYEDVTRCRHLTTGKKMTKLEGKGEFKLHHVRTNISKKISDTVKSGVTPTFKIVSKLQDPEALGAERVVYYGCKLDKAILMDFEAQKNGEESYSFTFEDWEFLDSISA